MKNKCQPAIKAAELESLLWFEIACFCNFGVVYGMFSEEMQKVKDYIDFLARGWQ